MGRRAGSIEVVPARCGAYVLSTEDAAADEPKPLPRRSTTKPIASQRCSCPACHPAFSAVCCESCRQRCSTCTGAPIAPRTVPKAMAAAPATPPAHPTECPSSPTHAPAAPHLHGLGTSGAQLAADNDLAALGAALHHKAQHTIARPAQRERVRGGNMYWGGGLNRAVLLACQRCPI